MRASSTIPEPITLAPYDPDWPKRFAQEVARITAAWPDTSLNLHHIGSTAISGMVAKPVIDILGTLPTLPTEETPLPTLGYEAFGAHGIPGRLYFRKTEQGRRSVHLHLFAENAPHAARLLRFRDHLRRDADAAAAYAALKQRLAKEHADDRAAYTDAKTQFIQQIEA